MITLLHDLENAVADAGVSARFLDQTEANQLAHTLSERFGPEPGTFLWQRMKVGGWHDPEGWRILCKMVNKQDVVLLGENSSGSPH